MPVLTHGGHDSGHAERPETREETRARIAAYNRRTAKLRPNGDASRDKLVSERLNLRQERS